LPHIENHRTAADKVTTELNIDHEDPVSIKIVRREVHKSNIYGTVTVAKHLIT